MIPIFDIVPVVQNRNGVRIGIVTVAGVSTAHNSTDTDHGKMYADVAALGGGTYRLDLFADFARAPETLVASGIAPAISTYFALTEQNASGVTGRARLEGVGATTSAILIVSFATDADVFANQADAAAMPGYDTDYGLALFHAKAMKQILLSDLPANMPNLFRGKKLSAFTPLDIAAEYPDLTVIESPDSLTTAQANLVKSQSAEQAEHLAEFSDMADAARARYVTAMVNLKTANTPEETEASEQVSGMTISEFSRW